VVATAALTIGMPRPFKAFSPRASNRNVEKDIRPPAEKVITSRPIKLIVHLLNGQKKKGQIASSDKV